MNTLHTRKTPDQIRQALSLLVLALRGTSDPTGMLQGFKLRLGTGLLSVFYQAYLTKAKGGTDEAGIQWAPLKKETIAYSRPHPGLNEKRKQAAAEGRPGRPLLSKDQDALWRRVYARQFHQFQNAGEADPSGHAAAYAWQVVKAAGGQTILDTYGNTQVEIGRSSGRMLNGMAAALTTGSAPDCEVRQEPGAVLVAIKVSYAPHFHAKRPLWDGSRPFPQAWREVLDDITSSFFSQALPRLLA
ncbi:MAG: hypothetical protein JNJ77_20125 [Planctomycetia bacterium]|nr:hypothetical protein [Planctomycetia bacterium]